MARRACSRELYDEFGTPLRGSDDVGEQHDGQLKRWENTKRLRS
jgi:hypothetical protein